MRSHLALPLLIFLSACTSLVDFEDRHENGAIKSEGKLIDQAQEGLWTYYWPNGKRKAQGNYERDEQVGSWTWWHENGNKRVEGEFANEHSVGRWRYWYPDGTLRMTGWFDRGRKSGEWCTYSSRGTLIQRGDYSEGKRDNHWSFYHEDGREKSSGWFFAGIMVGPWRRLSSEGQEIRQHIPLPEGVQLVRDYWSKSQLQRAGFLSKGVRSRRWVTWHDTGARRLSGDFNEGEPSGSWRAFKPNGELLGTGPVENGRPKGIWQWGEGATLTERATVDESRPPEVWSGLWSKAREIETMAAIAAVDRWICEVMSPCGTSDTVMSDVTAGSIATDEADSTAWSDAVSQEQPDLTPGLIPTRRVIDGLPRWLEDYTERVEHTGFDFYEEQSDEPDLGDLPASQRLVGNKLTAMKFLTSNDGMVDLSVADTGQWTVLVILRGFAGQVCPYCGPQLKALGRFKAEFDQLGVRVVAVYPGPKNGVAQFLRAYRNTYGEDDPPQYEILYDIDSKLAQSLGILNTKLDSPILARPTTLLLDDHATIQYAYVGKHDQDRPAAKSLIDELRKLSKQ